VFFISFVFRDRRVVTGDWGSFLAKEDGGVIDEG
jgi:hypothetical protein